jgi:hypothetical protein
MLVDINVVKRRGVASVNVWPGPPSMRMSPPALKELEFHIFCWFINKLSFFEFMYDACWMTLDS